MIALTRISHNRKTGPIPVSTSSKNTCPDSCPFKNAGCYAEGGPLNIHWLKVTSGERGLSDSEFNSAIKSLPKGQLWRHNQAGDLQGGNNFIDGNALKSLVRANKGRKGFTYTHKPVIAENVNAGHLTAKERALLAATNREKVKAANKGGFTVNLSGNDANHADKLKALNVGPVVSVVASDKKENFITKGGNKVVICPATIRDDVNCASCGLCQKKNRSCIVGFPAHGVSKKKMDANL